MCDTGEESVEHTLNKDALKDILNFVWDARAKWKDIGLKLGLTEGDIDAIHERDDGDSLREVLKQWLRSGEATIHQLFRGLRDIDRLDLVQKMRSDERCKTLLRKESFDYLELTCLEEMELKLSGKPVIEEIDLIPLTDWFKLGLYLGLQTYELLKIKEMGRDQLLDQLCPDDDNDSSNSSQIYSDKDENKDEIELPVELPVLQQYLMLISFIQINEEKIKADIRSLMSEDQKKTAEFLLFGSEIYKIHQCKQFLFSLETHAKEAFVPLIKKVWLKPVELVLGLVKVGCREIADISCKNKGVSLTHFLDAVDPALNPPDFVVEYSQFLKERYIQHFKSLPDEDWPPMGETSRQVFSNLAIIQRNEIYDSKPRDYAHGDIDRIVAVKEPIELDHIVLPICDSNTSNFVVLLEGAPGVGKTTVLKKFLLDWANGILLQEYRVVIYYSLRDLEHNYLDLAALLHPPRSKAQQVADYLEGIKISGKYCLLLLDGFDELSDENRFKKSSVVNQLIDGKILGNCSVIVASRPYATSRLRRNFRINKHIEVLGFTRKQILHHISTIIPSECESKALIQALDDRLDILSLCYIPLNCNILSFVYKQKGNIVPTTLTELYDTFILHTIKRSVIKQQSSCSLVEEIEEVDEISDLPESVLKQLDSLCKIAFCSLEKDQLSVSKAELAPNVDNILALGLLSSLQFMNERSIVKRYQFLHLTIQEFLAARYLAFQHTDKYAFFKNNVDKVRFRLTLMFLAGLTHLDFVPSGDVLLKNVLFIKKTEMELLLLDYTSSEIEMHRNSEYGEYWEPQNFERIEQWNTFLLHAQMFFESQRLSFKNMFSFQLDSFEIDGLTLSKFDSFAIAHLLASVPDDFVWNVLNLTCSGISVDSILYQKHLHTNPTEVCLKKACKLLLGDVPFACILSVLDRNIWLTHLQFNCKELNHFDFYNLCVLIAKSKCLQQMSIDNGHKRDTTIVSKQNIMINVTKEMCSASLILLLRFVGGQTLEHFNIACNKNAFIDCDLCQSNGVEAVDLFGKSIRTNFQSIDLSDCDISLETINALVSVMPTTGLGKVNVNGMDFKFGYGALPQLFSRGAEVIVHNLRLIPVSDYEIVIDDLEDDSETNLNKLFDKLVLPQTFTVLTCKASCSFEVGSPLSLYVPNSLRQNPQFTCMELTGHREDAYDNTPCSDLAQLVEALVHHLSIEYFSGFGLEYSKKLLSFSFGCAKLLTTLLTHADHVELITIDINCLSSCVCNARSMLVFEEELSKSLTQCTILEKLDLTDCNLSEETILNIVKTILASSVVNLNFNGNCIGKKLLSQILTLIIARPQIAISVYRLLLKLNNDNHHLEISRCGFESEVNNFLKSLVLPCEIRYVEFSSLPEIFDLIQFDTLTSFLSENPRMICVKFGGVERLSCSQSYRLSQSIMNHPALQEISFKLLIGRSYSEHYSYLHMSSLHIQCKEGICPLTLNNLINFLKPQSLKTVNVGLSGINNNSYIRCSHCNDDCWDVIFTAFLNLIARCHCLTKLDMSSCCLPTEAITRLMCQLKRSKSLKILNLSKNGISDAAIEGLSTMIALGSLEYFQSTEFIIIVKNRPNITMEIKMFKNSSINLLFQRFTLEDKVHQLKKVWIKCGHFFDSLGSSSIDIRYLALEQLQVTSISLESPQLLILGAVESCYLQDLSLESVNLDTSSAVCLLEKLTENKTLKCLNIAHNTLGDQQEELGEAFQRLLQRNKCLGSLNLCDCHLSLIVFRYIASGLSQNLTLKALDISKHKFENGQFIKQILKENKSIQSFKMSLCVLQDIVEGLRVNSTLKELHFEQNPVVFEPHPVSDEEWIYLFSSLQQNTTLRLLDIGFVLLDFKPEEALINLKRENTLLKVIAEQIQILPAPKLSLFEAQFLGQLLYSVVRD